MRKETSGHPIQVDYSKNSLRPKSLRHSHGEHDGLSDF